MDVQANQQKEKIMTTHPQRDLCKEYPSHDNTIPCSNPRHSKPQEESKCIHSLPVSECFSVDSHKPPQNWKSEFEKFVEERCDKGKYEETLTANYADLEEFFEKIIESEREKAESQRKALLKSIGEEVGELVRDCGEKCQRHGEENKRLKALISIIKSKE